MPTSSVTTFTDPCAYQEAVRSAQVEVLVTARGDFRAELTRIDLPNLSLQSGRETLPRVGRGAVNAQRTSVYFLVGTNQAAGVHSGVSVFPGEIVINAAGSTYHHVTSANCHWADVSLSPEDLAAAASALAGRELMLSDSPQILRPRPVLMSRLVNLQSAAGNLARTVPDLLTQAEVARALEQALTHAIVSCLTEGEVRQSYTANSYHRKVLERFEELLAERGNAPMHLGEICVAVGVPERTLRDCCQQHLGLGPIRYLWLRRMHLARQALLKADATSTTVTSIATEQGFWELGKFSVAYRSLFGEPPSATLRRHPGDRPIPQDSPFALPSAVLA
jgi:AraC-like DNA-binding protein